jgi:ribosomal protein S14
MNAIYIRLRDALVRIAKAWLYWAFCKLDHPIYSPSQAVLEGDPNCLHCGKVHGNLREIYAWHNMQAIELQKEAHRLLQAEPIRLVCGHCYQPIRFSTVEGKFVHVLPALTTAGNFHEAYPLPDGVACSHPGCLKHITHPCEVCGRVGGVSK